MKNLQFTFKQFPAEIQELAQSNNGLKQALTRLTNGTPPTPRSWFYETKSPQWILDQVCNKLNTLKDLKNIADWDLSKSDKFGPQGESAPLALRLESLNEYFMHLDAPEIIKDPIWQKAKKKAIRLLKFNRSGSPVTSQAVVDRGVSEQKYNTNSGYPLFIKRKRPEAKEEAVKDSMICIESKFPCLLGTRASMGKTGIKARNIFMASMAVNVRGQRFQQPLQDYIRSLHLDFFLPWEGWRYCQSNISSNWGSHHTLKFGTDYTKMDQHFNKFHALEVYDVIKEYFRPTYHDELKLIIEYVFQMPIITNLGMIEQEHAMPSGSEWTNFLESMWDYIHSIYLEEKYHLDIITKMGIGDDQLYLINGKWDKRGIDWIIATFVKEFERAGLPGNSEKQEVSIDQTSFLQRLLASNWKGNNGKTEAAGVYSLIRNVTSQVFPEFYHNQKEWDKSMFVLRVLMIAENANEHPLFEWYVKEFIAKANDNILEFIKAGSKHWIETMSKAKGISNFIPTYNQEKADKPLSEFDCVKLLLEVV